MNFVMDLVKLEDDKTINLCQLLPQEGHCDYFDGANGTVATVKTTPFTILDVKETPSFSSVDQKCTLLLDNKTEESCCDKSVNLPHREESIFTADSQSQETLPSVHDAEKDSQVLKVEIKFQESHLETDGHCPEASTENPSHENQHAWGKSRKRTKGCERKRKNSDKSKRKSLKAQRHQTQTKSAQNKYNLRSKQMCTKGNDVKDAVNTSLKTHNQQSGELFDEVIIKEKLARNHGKKSPKRNGVNCDVSGKPDCHQTTHMENNVQMCDICGKTFCLRINLEKHIKIHLAKPCYSCDTCGKSFILKEYLKDHIMRHERQQSDETFACEHCGQLYKLKQSLLAHIKQQHMQNPTFSCRVCGKHFRDKYDLMRHTRSHTGERILCDICGKPFVHVGDLNRHKASHASAEDDESKYLYFCEFCGMKFSERYLMLKHLNRKHRINRFSCEFCGKSYCDKYCLKVHIINKHLPRNQPISIKASHV